MWLWVSNWTRRNDSSRPSFGWLMLWSRDDGCWGLWLAAPVPLMFFSYDSLTLPSDLALNLWASCSLIDTYRERLISLLGSFVISVYTRLDLLHFNHYYFVFFSSFISSILKTRSLTTDGLSFFSSPTPFISASRSQALLSFPSGEGREIGFGADWLINHYCFTRKFQSFKVSPG